MKWQVIVHPQVARDFVDVPAVAQDEIASLLLTLKTPGPGLKRPRSDTLNGSRYRHMKELRFDAGNGVWR